MFSAGKEEKAIDVGGYGSAPNKDETPMKDHVKECKIWARLGKTGLNACQDPSHPAFILMNSICMKSCYVRAVSGNYPAFGQDSGHLQVNKSVVI